MIWHVEFIFGPKAQKIIAYVRTGFNGGHSIVLDANSSDKEIGCQAMNEHEAQNVVRLNGA